MFPLHELSWVFYCVLVWFLLCDNTMTTLREKKVLFQLLIYITICCLGRSGLYWSRNHGRKLVSDSFSGSLLYTDQPAMLNTTQSGLGLLKTITHQDNSLHTLAQTIWLGKMSAVFFPSSSRSILVHSYSQCQPIGWCCPHIGWVSPFQLTCPGNIRMGKTKGEPQKHPEFSWPSLVNNQNEPSWAVFCKQNLFHTWILWIFFYLFSLFV